MTIAYFDCFAGAGGDMIVASLLDAGANFDLLCTDLAKLGFDGYELVTEPVVRQGVSGRAFHVNLTKHDHGHRHLSHILEMIEAAGLTPRAARRARDIFTRLGQAEAAVHQIDIEKVHFHEVGAVDSIVDIVAAALAMEQLGIDQVFCSAIPVGSGMIECDHGILPVPAPATARLLIGTPTHPGPGEGELTTPTAAAVLTTLAEAFGPPPEMTISAIGYGAGDRELPNVPSLLRVFLGEPSEAGTTDSVVELSANLDDCTGEIAGATIDALLTAGCVDAWATPIYMKKNRPAWLLTALCPPGEVDRVERLLFAETSTFGIRRRTCARRKLARRHETVETPYGALRVKVGSLDARDMTASPEFTDCLSAATAHGVPVAAVMQAARDAFGRDGDRA